MSRRSGAAPLSRRRALGIVGAAAGCALLPGGAGAAAPRHEWRGVSLGAPARITLYHPERREARRLIGAALDEIERLEAEFSLFRPRSALSRLNAEGTLAGASHDMRRLMAEALRMSELSEGRFDVTVQPLWRLYAGFYGRHPGHPSGPPESDIRAAAALVDYRAVELGRGRLRLARPGMAATLNGIAQGYVTDRVAELLRGLGLANLLIDLGEHRALGRRGDGRPWRVGLRDPGGGEPRFEFALDNQAVATSGAYGTRFLSGLGHHHLFDPASGRSAGHWQSVSVIAGRATAADALSTALYLTPPDRVARLIGAAGAVRAHFLDHEGRLSTLPGAV